MLPSNQTYIDVCVGNDCEKTSGFYLEINVTKTSPYICAQT